MSAEGELIDRFEADAYADHLAMALVEVRPGYARAEMEAAEELAGFQGFLHAGALLSLAEYAFAVASNAHGGGAVPLTMSFTFVGLVRPGGRLVAEAVEEKLGRRTGLYRLSVTLKDGNLVASGQGVAYRQEPPTVGGPPVP
jgi:acyl-CoA thioesterase